MNESGRLYAADMEIRISSHGIYLLQYHIVWVTKYRRRILKPFVVEYLRKVLPNQIRSMPSVTIEQMGFDDDHMHMLMIIPPRYLLSELICQLKAQSASHMRKAFKWLSIKVYWKENVIWWPSNFLSSVGLDEVMILR
ncbi:IS200/IS605 family transposase [Neiella litorisoli]